MEFPVSSGQQHRITEAWNPDRNYNEYSRYSNSSQQQNYAAYEKQNYGTSRSYFSGNANSYSANSNSYSGNSNNSYSGNSNSYSGNSNSYSGNSNSYSGSSNTYGGNSNSYGGNSNSYGGNSNSYEANSNSYKNNSNTIPIATVLPSATQRQQQNYLSAFHNQLSAWATTASKQMQQQSNQNMSAKERNKGQLWAKTNSLTFARPLNSGRGMHLLQKMGWAPGEGLGREKRGSLQPLLFDVKLDRRGLVTNGERRNQRGYGRKQPKGPPPAKQPKKSLNELQENLAKKHPVTLLTEMAVKRKWDLPKFNLITESGTPQNKHFLFSVTFNGRTFTTELGGSSKKEARMHAAKSCLQALGVVTQSKVTNVQKQATAQKPVNTQNQANTQKQAATQKANTNTQKPITTKNAQAKPKTPITNIQKPTTNAQNLTTNVQKPTTSIQKPDTNNQNLVPVNQNLVSKTEQLSNIQAPTTKQNNSTNMQNLTSFRTPSTSQNLINIRIPTNSQKFLTSLEKPSNN